MHPPELSCICHIYTHLQTEMKRKAANISEPVFVNLLRSPEIDSQPGVPEPV
jgi:hypothetical protein